MVGLMFDSSLADSKKERQVNIVRGNTITKKEYFRASTVKEKIIDKLHFVLL